MFQPPPISIGLIVPVVEADQLVRAAQRRFEPKGPAANLGAELTAAHVTILWPFLPPDRLDKQVFTELQEICARHARHAFVLDRVSVFPSGAVHLSPTPPDALLELMRTVSARWPECPPYGGVYADVIPHVTVAVVENDPTIIQQVVSFAEAFLPIRAEARELQVVLLRNGTWSVLDRIPLGE